MSASHIKENIQIPVYNQYLFDLITAESILMTILVSGGAGYIGSHVVEQMIDRGYDVVVFDSLIAGHREAIHKDATFVQGDLLKIENNTFHIVNIFNQQNDYALLNYDILTNISNLNLKKRKRERFLLIKCQKILNLQIKRLANT